VDFQTEAGTHPFGNGGAKRVPDARCLNRAWARKRRLLLDRILPGSTPAASRGLSGWTPAHTCQEIIKGDIHRSSHDWCIWSATGGGHPQDFRRKRRSERSVRTWPPDGSSPPPLTELNESASQTPAGHRANPSKSTLLEALVGGPRKILNFSGTTNEAAEGRRVSEHDAESRAEDR